MKIYIPNILPSSLNNKLDKLCLHFGEPEPKIKYEIISKEFGLIIIEEQYISHIESSFKTNYELIKNYNNYDLLVDRTNNTKIPLTSQFPVNYIHTRFLKLNFKTHKKSKLSLVINYLEEPNNFELIRIPVDFYFEYDNDNVDLNDPFFQEEFNMFLSTLN
jgi:hypothetical protein